MSYFGAFCPVNEELSECAYNTAPVPIQRFETCLLSAGSMEPLKSSLQCSYQESELLTYNWHPTRTMKQFAIPSKEDNGVGSKLPLTIQRLYYLLH